MDSVKRPNEEAGADSDVLRVEDVGPVRVLTLNRPAARNALSVQLVLQLGRAIDALEQDDGVRAVVLTGADPAFCAGLDLKEAASGGSSFFARFRAERPIDRLASISTPLVGAINGPTFTGGLELALACDFLIASERAAFADTHARVGFMPRSGMTIRLPELVGRAQAVRMSMTGEVVDAARAERIGLVTEVVAHDRLRARAVQLAQQIAESPAGTVGSIKRMYAVGSDAMLTEARRVAEEVAVIYKPDFAGLEQRRASVLTRNRAEFKSETAGDSGSRS